MAHCVLALSYSGLSGIVTVGVLAMTEITARIKNCHIFYLPQLEFNFSYLSEF